MGVGITACLGWCGALGSARPNVPALRMLRSCCFFHVYCMRLFFIQLACTWGCLMLVLWHLGCHSSTSRTNPYCLVIPCALVPAHAMPCTWWSYDGSLWVGMRCTVMPPVQPHLPRSSSYCGVCFGGPQPSQHWKQLVCLIAVAAWVVLLVWRRLCLDLLQVLSWCVLQHGHGLALVFARVLKPSRS